MVFNASGRGFCCLRGGGADFLIKQMTGLARSIFMVLAAAGLALLSGCGTGRPAEARAIHLLNGKDLSAFYTFLSGYGKNNDVDGVFTMSNGVLRISGQHPGYLATKREYANYRLVAEFKWGNVTWTPRQYNARASGILVNMAGEDMPWPKSIGCELAEGGTGDIFVMNGAYLTVDGVTKGPGTERFDRPGRNPWKDQLGFRGTNEFENPHGEWNTVEIICNAGRVGVTVNGQKTLEGMEARPNRGK